MGHPRRTLLSDGLVGHSCGTLLRGILVGHTCRALSWGAILWTLLWDTLVRYPYLVGLVGHSAKQFRDSTSPNNARTHASPNVTATRTSTATRNLTIPCACHTSNAPKTPPSKRFNPNLQLRRKLTVSQNAARLCSEFILHTSSSHVSTRFLAISHESDTSRLRTAAVAQRTSREQGSTPRPQS